MYMDRDGENPVWLQQNTTFRWKGNTFTLFLRSKVDYALEAKIME